jgi:hypothetical protein
VQLESLKGAGKSETPIIRTMVPVHSDRLAAVVEGATGEVIVAAEKGAAHAAADAVVLNLKSSPDVALIARAMMEGLCQLQWADRDRATRAQQWRDFVWVHDWRVVRVWRARGVRVSKRSARTVERNLELVAGKFLTKKGAEAISTVKEPCRPLPPELDLQGS